METNVLVGDLVSGKPHPLDGAEREGEGGGDIVEGKFLRRRGR